MAPTTAPEEATKNSSPSAGSSVGPEQPNATIAPSSGGVGIPSLRDRIPQLEPRKKKQQPENTLPVPETPALPSRPDRATLTFKVPSRRILSSTDHKLFLGSLTYKLVLAFVFGLSESVADTPASAVKDSELSEPVKVILKILDEAETL